VDAKNSRGSHAERGIVRDRDKDCNTGWSSSIGTPSACCSCCCCRPAIRLEWEEDNDEWTSEEERAMRRSEDWEYAGRERALRRVPQQGPPDWCAATDFRAHTWLQNEQITSSKRSSVDGEMLSWRWACCSRMWRARSTGFREE
jgi:hypothetical protein